VKLRSARRTGVLLALAIAALAVFGAGSAAAATVVNGDFETGNLNGWQTYSQTGGGEWYVYNNTEEEPGSPWIFSGTWTAGSGEMSPDTVILYQDVALEPLFSHQLTLRYRYFSEAPLVTPSPNTLDVEANEGDLENQQDIIDVIKPGAPLTTTNPTDILTTIFATNAASPEEIPATTLSADLSPFAGQTVRLRFVTLAHAAPNYAAVDDVKITSTALPPPPPSNLFAKGKLKLNKANGTAKLALTVPGPGVVTAVDAKKKKKLVKGTSVTASAAGTITVPLKPTGKGTKALNANGKVAFKVKLSFTPTGGTAATQTATGTLKLAPPKG
jgi:hypothetical protein